MIRRIMLAVAACTALVAEDAAPATVVLKNVNDSIRVEVVAETLDEVVYKLSDSSGNKIEQKAKADQILRIEYEPAEMEFQKADAEAGRGNHDKAAESYQAVMDSARWRWTREAALIRGARSWLAAKKPENALKLLDKLEATYKRSVHLPAAAELRVDAALARPDQAAAEAALKKFQAEARGWGPKAEVKALLAEVRVLRAAKNEAGALAKTQEAFKRMGSDADGYGGGIL